MEKTVEAMQMDCEENSSIKEAARLRKNRKQREKRLAARLATKSKSENCLKPCKHNNIIVALNPGPKAKVLQCFTSTCGDVIANVCYNCSDSSDVLNTFGEKKNAQRVPRIQSVLIPLTEDGVSWLATSPFTHVHSVSEEGITMFIKQSLTLPPGGQYLKCFTKNTIVVGKSKQPEMARIPKQDAVLLAKTYMK